MRMNKGPREVLHALAFGDEDQVAEALEFQRESFRAAIGFYPEELQESLDQMRRGEGRVLRPKELPDEQPDHLHANPKTAEDRQGDRADQGLGSRSREDSAADPS